MMFLNPRTAKELDASRREALSLRSELSEVYARSAEVARKVEAAQGTVKQEIWNQDEQKKPGQQQEVQEASKLLDRFRPAHIVMTAFKSRGGGRSDL